MRKIRRLLPIVLMVGGLTLGASALHAQPADEAATAAEAPAAPEAAPAAPSAPAPAPAPAAEPPKPAADTGADSASSGEAPDPAGDVDLGGTFGSLFKAVTSKDWAAGLAALVLIIAYGFSRKTWIKKLPVVGDWISTTDFGGLVGAFVAAFLASYGTAALADTSVMFTLPTLVLALKVAVAAVGGYSGIWKKLPFNQKPAAEPPPTPA
jgi:hypothetical protein